MNVKKTLLIKSLREIAACLSHKNKQTTDIQKENTKMSINLSYFESASEKLR